MNNKGTLVTAPIRPQSVDDTFPTAYANELKGGYQTCGTIVARNNIPSIRREINMLCYVEETDTFYQLKSGIENINWTPVTFGGGSSNSWTKITRIIITNTIQANTSINVNNSSADYTVTGSLISLGSSESAFNENLTLYITRNGVDQDKSVDVLWVSDTALKFVSELDIEDNIIILQ